ncbi:ABC transporter permease [Paenibacillus brasilensis]|uniref:ABC transport system permease protein n=2 Tax=Paenibacillus brasilensis TaxID=128574 RepID=A0ABU0L7D9_9BACL|nr:FtsX-like permease family protein [Paenibacillus brasilensis]MDQ0497135.1 putative ABC transport system permease protein [Paenibacillus brasilensis]
MTSIAIGVASFFCMSMLSELVPQAVHESSKKVLGGDIEIQAYMKPTTLTDLEKVIPDHARKNMTIGYVTNTMIKSDHKITNAFVKGIDPKQYPLYGEDMLPGVRSLRENEVLITKNLANRLQVQEGDNISLPNKQGELNTFQIRGLVEKAQESYGDSMIFGMIYMGYNQLIQLQNLTPGITNEAWVTLTNNEEIGQIRKNTTTAIEGSNVLDSGDKEKKMLIDVRSLLLFLRVFSLITLAIAGMTTFNTMTIMMSTRIREVAVMKAIGLKNSFIMYSFAVEAFLIGLLGTMGGILVGELASVWFSSYMGAVLVLPLHWEFSWQAIVSTLPVGILVTIIAAWMPLRSVSHMSPLQLLRGTEPIGEGKLPFFKKLQTLFFASVVVGFYLQDVMFDSVGSFQISNLLLASLTSMVILLLIIGLINVTSWIFGLLFRLLGRGKSLFSQPIYLALHNLSMAHKRNGLLSVTLTVGVLSVVLSHVLTDNLIQVIQMQMEVQSKGNVLLTSSASDVKVVEHLLSTTDGVISYKKGYKQETQLLQINDQSAIEKLKSLGRTSKVFENMKFSTEAVDLQEKNHSYKISSGRDFTPEDNGALHALLIEDFQTELGVKQGDTLKVNLDQKTMNVKVIGFFESNLFKTAEIRLPEQTMQKYGQSTSVSYYVDANAGKIQDILDLLNQKLPKSAMAYSIKQTVAESLQNVVDTFSNFFSIVSLLAFLTSGLMIGNQVVISLLQQKRDVAIMKTVGVSTRKLISSILTEKAILSFVAGVVASGLALIFSFVILLSVFHVSLMLMNAYWVVIGIGMSMLVTLLVSLLASLQSMAAKPIEMLR